MIDRRGNRLAQVTALLGGALVLSTLLGACSTATPTAAPTITPAPTVAATVLALPTAPPTAVATPTGSDSGVPECSIADLKASHGVSDGAAGSIFTEVVLVSDLACSTDATPSLGLQDAHGSPLVEATAAGPGSIELVVGDAYTSQIRLANWCGPDPSFPLSLVLWIDSEKLVVTGGSFPDDGMPGCLGEGGVRLESTPWVATP
jgi:hypothetical protein